MLDIRRIRERTEEVRRGLAAKGDAEGLDRVLAWDRERRELITETERLKQERNSASREIGLLLKQGRDAGRRQGEVRELGERIKAMDRRLREVEDQLSGALLLLPNVPHESVPPGADAGSNRLVKTWGTLPSFSFRPQPHWELGEALGWFDFARAAKISGTGFPLFRGGGARLERALIQFMLDLHTGAHGYEEVAPPLLCNRAAMTGTGQLPKMEEDMYLTGADDLFLIPTAEVPLTNLFRDEILADPLPVRLTAYTPCFRREAGAAGRDTRGLNRVHQFDKVELVQLVEPQASSAALEELLGHAERVLQLLELPYRVLELCAGDLSFAAAKCYDLELWAPGQEVWLEVSSCSNFEDFQARRAQIRYRNEAGKVEYVHTLNGSGVALARLVVALMENGQQEDGAIRFPDALQPYLEPPAGFAGETR